MKKTSIRTSAACWVLLALTVTALPAAGAAAGRRSDAPKINPHWTGRHCRECHIHSEPGTKGAELRYGGDSIALCNRCHADESGQDEIHPVPAEFSAAMQGYYKKDWPLRDGRLTCRSCHAALLQMKPDPEVRRANPDFLRDGPYPAMADFCFVCHVPGRYQKYNPHRQLGAGGEIEKDRCLFCHRALPDRASTPSGETVSFRGELSRYCVDCHFTQKKGHPAGADHLVKMPEAMLASLRSGPESPGADLPLLSDGRVYCATCHNPHEKGVIGRAAAACGAGEAAFLRFDRGRALCVACHVDKRPPEGERKRAGASFDEPQKILSTHRPAAENKCKLCHTATARERRMPEPINFCFGQGCHRTEMLEREYKHEQSVLEDCLLCHVPHSSGYGGLLVDRAARLCRGCHPHIRNKTGRALSWPAVPGRPGEDRAAAGDTPVKPAHADFVEFVGSIKALEGKECYFCHTAGHSRSLGQVDLGTCSSCHIFVQEALLSVSDRPLNVHQIFCQERCTMCHDPHSAQNEHLLILKQPLEKYCVTDSRRKKDGAP